LDATRSGEVSPSDPEEGTRAGSSLIGSGIGIGIGSGIGSGMGWFTSSSRGAGPEATGVWFSIYNILLFYFAHFHGTNRNLPKPRTHIDFYIRKGIKTNASYFYI
jgi:hypothetical protein